MESSGIIHELKLVPLEDAPAIPTKTEAGDNPVILDTIRLTTPASTRSRRRTRSTGGDVADSTRASSPVQSESDISPTPLPPPVAKTGIPSAEEPASGTVDSRLLATFVLAAEASSRVEAGPAKPSTEIRGSEEQKLEEGRLSDAVQSQESGKPLDAKKETSPGVIQPVPTGGLRAIASSSPVGKPFHVAAETVPVKDRRNTGHQTTNGASLKTTHGDSIGLPTAETILALEKQADIAVNGASPAAILLKACSLAAAKSEDSSASLGEVKKPMQAYCLTESRKHYASSEAPGDIKRVRIRLSTSGLEAVIAEKKKLLEERRAKRLEARRLADEAEEKRAEILQNQLKQIELELEEEDRLKREAEEERRTAEESLLNYGYEDLSADA